MATSISAILIPCLKSFNQLQERVEQPDYSCEKEVSSVAWRDELGRLRIWAANIGAHQTGQSSLDFRLRDASHISKQITKLLQDLDHSLNDIIDELSEDGTQASEDDETSAAWPDHNSTTELQQLHEEVVNIIDCLYQLSIVVRKPAQHDLLVGSHMGDKAEFEFYDKEHVRNLHPKTEEQISQRLGRAITRRRKYLNYRGRHHRKLEKGIEEVQGIQRTTTASVMSETIATDFKTHNIDFEETSSNSGMSQTSYALSLIDGRITIPPPPRESVGAKPFECPYCFFVINPKTTKSWNRHIFRDIKPYVCTFTDCSIPDRVYDSRREWYLHETTEHHREDFECALCKDTLKSSKQYEHHVARHLEELALFALPRIEMDDAEDNDSHVLDAGASTSENDVALDSPSGGSSVDSDEGKASPHAAVSTSRRDDPSNSPSTPVYRYVSEQEGAERRIHFEEHFALPLSQQKRSLGIDRPSDIVSRYLEHLEHDENDNDAGDSVSHGVGEAPETGVDKSDASLPAQVTINGATFSKYECEISCAIKLWIKNANNAVPSDDTLGYIVNSLRGNVNGTALPCQNIVPQIQRHSQEVVRSIYMSVYINKSYWGREASRVYYVWLKQNDNIVNRLKATGALAPFLNPDGTLKAKQNDRQQVCDQDKDDFLVPKSADTGPLHHSDSDSGGLRESESVADFDDDGNERAESEQRRKIRNPNPDSDLITEWEKKELKWLKAKLREDPTREGRSTYIKVHRKHVIPETLDEYDLPWEFDERDLNYLIIKRWIPEQEQIVLFEHSKNLRLKKPGTHSKEELTREWDGEKPLLVMKRPPEAERPTREEHPFVRLCSHTSWKRIKSETNILQWNCTFCNSTDHWFIFECLGCGRKSCHSCSQKTHL